MRRVCYQNPTLFDYADKLLNQSTDGSYTDEKTYTEKKICSEKFISSMKSKYPSVSNVGTGNNFWGNCSFYLLVIWILKEAGQFLTISDISRRIFDSVPIFQYQKATPEDFILKHAVIRALKHSVPKHVKLKIEKTPNHDITCYAVDSDEQIL